ncbi:MAG: T9SS type A sorting domain-containing protein [Ignavibacteriales bacterium]|nr:T9SS type A sorting domain-containing protein [Ignavibacteriales bacterium]
MGFNIERADISNDVGNLSWKTIGFLNGSGTSTEQKSYSFNDENLTTGKYQYRLKQIDFDGSFEYSNQIETEITSLIAFSLEQNYPNPFNPSTTIKYNIPSVISSEGKNVIVTVKVYDVMGNEIATLVNENKSVGNYEVVFNAKNLSSGVYFYKLKVGNRAITKKMVLIR